MDLLCIKEGYMSSIHHHWNKRILSHEQTKPGRSLMEKNGSTLHHQSENKWQEEPLFRDPTHTANVLC
jgi:hypothetical protein